MEENVFVSILNFEKCLQSACSGDQHRRGPSNLVRPARVRLHSHSGQCGVSCRGRLCFGEDTTEESVELSSQREVLATQDKHT